MTDLNSSFVFKTLTASAVEQIADIESTAHINPWSRQQLRACFSQQLNRITGLFDGKKLIAYSMVQSIPPEAELLNLAIARQFQFRGIGTLLIDQIVNQCRAMHVRRLFLEVRESNEPAISLYQRCGFKLASVRDDYYQAEDQTESAIVMRLEIGDD